jgi:threonine dehydratase
MMPWPITYDDVLAAHDRIAPVLPPPPLRSYARLDEALDMHVLVKHENHQPTNAFKVRNALAAMTTLSDDEKRRGVIAATMGNYGQGLAWAGRELDVDVVVCVPHGVNPDKIDAIRGFGAELVIEGETYDDAVVVQDRLVNERGLLALHGVNHPMMPAGAGTITLEIIEQCERLGESLDSMFIGVGGGSQAVGAMTVLRHRSPNTRVIGVQSAGASAIHDACRANDPAIHRKPDTIAEGLATGQTYEQTFAPLRDGLADFVTVTDAELLAAMRLIMTSTHNLIEPAAAAGVAAAINLRDTLRGRTVAVILSGANVDMRTLARILNER